jgi:phospholipid transport system substrate-binding protein
MTTHNLLRTLLTGFFLFISITATAATEKLQAPQLVIDNTSQILLKKLKEPGFASNKTEIRSPIWSAKKKIKKKDHKELRFCS